MSSDDDGLAGSDIEARHRNIRPRKRRRVRNACESRCYGIVASDDVRLKPQGCTASIERFIRNALGSLPPIIGLVLLGVATVSWQCRIVDPADRHWLYTTAQHGRYGGCRMFLEYSVDSCEWLPSSGIPYDSVEALIRVVAAVF